MPIDFICEQCGRKMRAPDGTGGRKASCPICGQTQLIPGELPSPSVELEPPASPAPGLRGQNAPADLRTHRRPVMSGISGPERSFAADVALSFKLPFKGAGLFLWIMIGLIHLILVPLGAMVLFGDPLAMLGFFSLCGWLCSCYFAIILETCSGKDDLPTMGLSGGLWDDVFAPLLKFMGSLSVVMLPLIVWNVAVSAANPEVEEPPIDPSAMLPFSPDAQRFNDPTMQQFLQDDPFSAGAGEIPNPYAAPPEPEPEMIIDLESISVVSILASLGLYLLGLFLWPMMILTVVINGLFAAVGKIPEQLASIFKALPQYLSICGMLLGVGLIAVLSTVGVTILLGMLGESHKIMASILTGVLPSLILSYFIIIAMRIIGLFYRHYKTRFAWKAE